MNNRNNSCACPIFNSIKARAKYININTNIYAGVLSINAFIPNVLNI